MKIISNTKLIREIKPGWIATKVVANKHTEWHITITPLAQETPESLITRLASWIKEKKAVIVKHEIFGGLKFHSQLLQLLESKLGLIDWHITWTEGSPLNNKIFGMNIIAIEGTPISILKYENNIVGCSFSDGYARHLLLGNLHPLNTTSEKPEQMRELFERIEQILKLGFMDYSNVVRTWFFLDDILSWYTPFNTVRTEFYKKLNLFDKLVPASTGIGGSNIYNAAAVAALWAVQPQTDACSIKEIPSPLQCPAPCYGSSFSRAVEIQTPELRRLFISGTASIHQDGTTAHINDIKGQVDLTMRVVEAILKLRGMDFNSTTRSIAYFKNIEHREELDIWFSNHNISNVPVVITQADICRDDLLFEIELDAISTDKI
ncbi:MAG: RidA family protein [Verrucomicrobiia bacterium]